MNAKKEGCETGRSRARRVFVAGPGRGGEWSGLERADRNEASWLGDSFSSSTNHIPWGSGPVRKRAGNAPGDKNARPGIARFGERDGHSADPTAAATARSVRGPGGARKRSLAERGCRHWDGGGNKIGIPGRADTGRRSPRPSDDARRVATAGAFAPGAPNCDAPRGPSESRFRPETPARPLGGGLFFNGRPGMAHPVAHGFFISLDGPALWFLGTPAQGMQKATDMIGVIVHMETASNPLRHTRTGPQLGFKTSG